MFCSLQWADSVNLQWNVHYVLATVLFHMNTREYAVYFSIKAFKCLISRKTNFFD